MTFRNTEAYIPAGARQDVLEKNLEAMARKNPRLVERIASPVDGRHIRKDGDGKIYYCHYSSRYPLAISENALKEIDNEIKDAQEVFVFGIGLGEQVDYLLERLPEKRLIVWDRDPWLVRLFLMRKDYSTCLAEGRLRLMMCADLVGYLRRAKNNDTVYHPLFRELYRNEVALIASGLGASRILVNAAGLLVDDVTEALNDIGHTTFYLNLERISLEEIEWAIVQYMPSVIFSVNYYNGLAGLCEKYGLKLICWEIDPCLDSIEKTRAVNGCSYIFTFRRANVDTWRQAGFENSYYLPLASNCEKRKPVSLSCQETDRFGCDVSFVGDSMAENGRRFRDIFVARFDTYARGRLGFPKGQYLFEKLLEMQRKDFSRYTVAELVDSHCGGFVDEVRGSGNGNMDPVAFVAEAAAHEKRLAYIGTLGKYQAKVWGDDGWRELEATGIEYMGYAGHKHELNKVYCGSKINVDVNRLYQSDIVTLRIFDVMACGGFVLAEYSNELDCLFELDREIAAYRTADELLEKVDYYLNHTDERLRIAKRGMAAVRARHSIRERVESMIRVVDGDRRTQ